MHNHMTPVSLKFLSFSFLFDTCTADDYSHNNNYYNE